MKYDYLNQLFHEDDEFEDLFKDFDFNLLDTPEFKEDSVREEIIFPILKRLGYSASSENKIIRSKTLKHPFCYFGTKKYNVNIIPDYTFEIGGQTKWVLDAKRPTENISSGKNVSQAYSYAVHQEIQSELFALCNGKQIVVFSIKEHLPILNFHIKDLKANWNSLVELLSPEFVSKPFLKNFKLDFGLFILKTGTERCFIEPMCFPFDTIHFIGKVSDNHYAINGQFKYDYEGYRHQEFMGTFDFKEKEFQELLAILPSDFAKQIIKSLTNQPFRYMELNPPPFNFEIYATLSHTIISNENESYLPLIVSHFNRL